MSAKLPYIFAALNEAHGNLTTIGNENLHPAKVDHVWPEERDTSKERRANRRLAMAR